MCLRLSVHLHVCVRWWPPSFITEQGLRGHTSSPWQQLPLADSICITVATLGLGVYWLGALEYTTPSSLTPHFFCQRFWVDEHSGFARVRQSHTDGEECVYDWVGMCGSISIVFKLTSSVIIPLWGLNQHAAMHIIINVVERKRHAC